MKKVVVTCFFCLVVFCGMAQQMSLGLKASPGISWIKPDTKGVQGDGSIIGFAYGAIFDWMFTENYGLGSGIFIHHQGGKMELSVVDTSGTTGIVSEKYKLQYLNIPLTLKMRTNEIGYFRYFGQFGLMPGINLGAKGTQEIPGTKTDIENVKDHINNFNVALVIGLGTMYNFSGNTSLLLGIEWNNGFTDPFKGSELNGKSNFLMINTGVIF